jgi:hypothetical protein
MMDRAWVVCIPDAHRTEGQRDAGVKIIELAEQYGGQCDPYRDTYRSIQVMAVDKTLILFNIIHADRKIFCRLCAS